MAATVARFATLAVAVVGIGAFGSTNGTPNSSLVRSGSLGPGKLRRLSRPGAGGDLIVHPFTLEGEFVAPDLAARAIATSIDELRRGPQVVAVAAGPAKVTAIRGGLATGLIRTLVTDASTAFAMLETEP